MGGSKVRDEYYYRCRGKQEKKTSCTSSRVLVDEVEDFVLRGLCDGLLNEESISNLLGKFKKEAQNKAIESVSDAITLNERLDEINAQSENLVTAIMDMGGSDTIRNKLKALEDERKKIASTIAELTLETKVYTSNEEEIAAFLYDDLAGIKSENDEERNKVVKKYAHKVRIIFDPEDSPRPGHKRNYDLEIEAAIAQNRRASGTPKGNRTPVFAVRGRRLDRLTMEAWLPN